MFFFIRVEGFNTPPLRTVKKVLNPEYKYLFASVKLYFWFVNSDSYMISVTICRKKLIFSSNFMIFYIGSKIFKLFIANYYK